MKRIKVLAVIMIAFAVLSTTVYATATPSPAPTTIPATGEQQEVADGQGLTTEVKGTILATSIKVTVPTSINFDVDITKNIDGASAGQNQVVTTSFPSIANHSPVPVYVQVTNVATDAAITLINDAPILNLDWGLKNVMFAISDKAASYTTSTDPLKLLMATNVAGGTNPESKYFINENKGMIAARDGKSTLQVFAATRTGWTASDVFTVTPTFTIYTTPPTV